MVIEERERELYGFRGPKSKKISSNKASENVPPQSWSEQANNFRHGAISKVALPKIVIRLAYILFGAFVIFLILGTIYYAWLYFHRGDIELGLSGPSEIISGENNGFTISFTNFSRKPINNVQLEINLLDNGL